MICKHCGAEIAEGSAFCTNCGKSVETLVAAPESLSEALTSITEGQEKTSPSSEKEKSKGLLAPLITLIASASGWLYVLFSNSIEGIKAWFVSSQDMQDSLSGRYEYFGNNGGTDETIGAIVLIAVMVLFTLLGVVGLVMLVKRLIRKFAPKRK